MRETEALTALEKELESSPESFDLVKSEARKGSDAAPAAWPSETGAGKEAFRVGEQGNVTAVVRSEVVDDPVVGADERDAEHERDGHAHPLMQPRVVPFKDRPVAHAGAMRPHGIQQERSAEGAGDCADGQRRDAEIVEEDDTAEDGAAVVNQRRDGLNVELLAHQQDRAEDAAGEEEDRRDQKNAREPDTQRGLRGIAVEPAQESVHEDGRQEFTSDDGDCKDTDHSRQDDGHGALALSLATRVAVARQHGHEGDGRSAADQEV